MHRVAVLLLWPNDFESPFQFSIPIPFPEVVVLFAATNKLADLAGKVRCRALERHRNLRLMSGTSIEQAILMPCNTWPSIRWASELSRRFSQLLLL